MNSIGNDIVDLHFIDKERTRSKPFYTKILSESEQALYPKHFKHIPFWQYVWLLWSCKEAVYKFIKRLQPELVFSPVKISLESRVLEPAPIAIGIKNFQKNPLLLKFYLFLNSEIPIAIGTDPIFCHSTITDDYIHIIANNTENFAGIIYEVKDIDSSDYKSQSAEVRRRLMEHLNVNYPGQRFDISKSDVGYPIVKSGEEAELLTSFAHHGNYVAFAFKKLL